MVLRATAWLGFFAQDGGGQRERQLALKAAAAEEEQVGRVTLEAEETSCAADIGVIQGAAETKTEAAM